MGSFYSNRRQLVYLFPSYKYSYADAPALGRFTSADSIIPSSVQGLDRYAYVNNSPVNFTDPTGHVECEPGDDTCQSPGSTSTGSAFVSIFTTTSTSSSNESGGSNNESEKPYGKNGSKHNDLKDFSPVTETKTSDCSHGWVSAMFTPDGSCGHVTVNPNAIVDPLAWEHIAGGILGGVVLVYFGVMMIDMGIGLCTTVIGCFAGIFGLILPGVGGIAAGGALIWSGIKFGEIYLDEVFEVSSEKEVNE